MKSTSASIANFEEGMTTGRQAQQAFLLTDRLSNPGPRSIRVTCNRIILSNEDIGQLHSFAGARIGRDSFVAEG